MQCGAGQPGSLDARTDWRPLSTLLLVALLLLGAAAAAGAAALNSNKAAPPHTLTVAQAPTPTTSTPTTSTPLPRVPTTPGATSTPTPKAPVLKTPAGGSTSNTPLFPKTSKPPKIPAPAATPHTTATGTGTGTGSTGTGTGKSTGGANSEKTPQTGSPSSGEGSGEGPSAILLDTNAASNYNPYNYPEAGFGDPALAIDSEASTAWTAPVQAAAAPRMAEGLLINLKTPTKVGAVELVTDTTGMTVQLYGATEASAPSTITEQGWIPLSASRVLQKHKTRVKLKAGVQTRALRYVLVWLVKAPASAVGTAQAPGHVDLNQVELFGPAG